MPVKRKAETAKSSVKRKVAAAPKKAEAKPLSQEEKLNKLVDSFQYSEEKFKKVSGDALVEKVFAVQEEISSFLPHFFGQKVEKQIPDWFPALREKYVNSLLSLFSFPDFEVQSAILSVLMKLLINVSFEKAATKENLTLDDFFFSQIVKGIVHSANFSEELLDFFGEEYVAENDDVRYFLFVNLRRIAEEEIKLRKKDEKREEEIKLSEKIYSFLKNLELPTEIDKFLVGEPILSKEMLENLENERDDEDPSLDDAEDKKRKKKLAEIELANELNQEKILDRIQGRKVKKTPTKKEEKQKTKPAFAPIENLKRKKLSSLNSHKAAAQGCWLSFLKLKKTPTLYKQILVSLEKDVIPLFNTPAFLSDFLVDSFDMSGVIAMLALEGLLTLMTKHNLDYPSYYKKLYSLLNADSFLTRYRSRFFKLLDVSLSSKYLPAYVAASFAKKLGRLALTAPPHGITLSLVLIYNLILRNPSLKVLIHREPKIPVKQVLLIGMREEYDPTKPLEECNGFDPFLFSEPDLDKTNALESSLWELDILKNHYCPQISRLTKILETETKVTYNVADFIDESYDSIFAQNTNREPKVSPPFEFEKPESLFGDDFGIWNLVA